MMFNNNGYVSEILRSPVFAATVQCRAVTLPKTIILPSPQKTVITGFEASSPSFGSRLSHAWPYANSKRRWSARKRHARREWSRELVEYERRPCAGKTRTFHELSVFETVFAAPAKRSKRHCTCRAYGSVRRGNVVKPRFFRYPSRLTFSPWSEFGRTLRSNFNEKIRYKAFFLRPATPVRFVRRTSRLTLPPPTPSDLNSAPRRFDRPRASISRK